MLADPYYPQEVVRPTRCHDDDSVSGIYTDSVSGVYTSGDDHDDDSHFRARVVAEDRRVFEMYGIASDMMAPYSSVGDSTSVQDDIMAEDLSTDGSYSMTDLSAKTQEEVVAEGSSLANSEAPSLFSNSWTGIMNILASFTPSSSAGTKAGRSTTIDLGKPQDATDSSDSEVQDLDDGPDDFGLPDTIRCETNGSSWFAGGFCAGGNGGRSGCKGWRWVLIGVLVLTLCAILGTSIGILSQNNKSKNAPAAAVETDPAPQDPPSSSDIDHSITSENDLKNEADLDSHPQDHTGTPLPVETSPPSDTDANDIFERPPLPEKDVQSEVEEILVADEEYNEEEDELIDMPIEQEDTTPIIDCLGLISTSCTDHLQHGCTESGLYWIHPGQHDQPFSVYCDQTTEMFGYTGGWTLFLSTEVDTELDFSARLLPTDTGALSDDEWIRLRDNMSVGIMAMDANEEIAFISKQKLQQAECWTPWDIPTLVPTPESSFVGLTFSNSDGDNGAKSLISFSLFRTEKHPCDLVGDDFCSLQVSTSEGSGPFNRCGKITSSWDVLPSLSWSFQSKILFFIR